MSPREPVYHDRWHVKERERQARHYLKKKAILEAEKKEEEEKK